MTFDHRWFAAAVLLTTVTANAGRAEPPAPHFRYERSVTPGAAGPNRLAIDVPLLAGTQPLRYAPVRPAGSAANYGGGLEVLGTASFAGGLDDLRLYDPSGHEVGYLLVAPPPHGEVWQDGHLLPIQSTEEESGFEIDVGHPMRVDRLRLRGIPSPFLKRVRLEAGGDRLHWAVLIGQGTLFDLPEEHLQRTELIFAPGDFQYFRVAWDDRNSASVPLPHTVSARVATPLAAAPATMVPIPFERRPSEPGRSRFRLHLPATRLPVTALELACGGGHLLRDAHVSEPRLSAVEVVPVLLGSSTLRRTVRDGAIAAELRVPIAAAHGSELDLVVDDGNNPPLELVGVSAELAPLPWIYFESPTGETVTARFGAAHVPPPRYDLEAMRSSLERLQFAEARWGESREFTPATETIPDGSALPPRGTVIDTTAFRYTRTLPPGPDGLTAVVLDAAVLAHSRDLNDLRIADAEGYQVPYIFEKLDEPLSIDLSELQPVVSRSAQAETGRSHYRVMLPYETLPPSQLILTTTARVFERRITLTVERAPAVARSQPRTDIIASATWRHIESEEPPPALVLSLPSLGVSAAELVIDEGDNSPLPLSRPKLLLPAYRLRFFGRGEEELRLLYGHADLGGPRYDLALLAPHVLGGSAHEITPALEAFTASVPVRHGTSRETKLFWAVLIIVVLVLMALIARLVAKAESPPAGS